MGAVDLKSMEGSSRNRPANGRSSSSVHGVGRERESEMREREREMRSGWVKGRYASSMWRTGMAGEDSMASTWRRPVILDHGAGETEPSRDRPPSQADCPLGAVLQSFPLKEILSRDF